MSKLGAAKAFGSQHWDLCLFAGVLCIGSAYQDLLILSVRRARARLTDRFKKDSPGTVEVIDTGPPFLFHFDPSGQSSPPNRNGSTAAWLPFVTALAQLGVMGTNRPFNIQFHLLAFVGLVALTPSAGFATVADGTQMPTPTFRDTLVPDHVPMPTFRSSFESRVPTKVAIPTSRSSAALPDSSALETPQNVEPSDAAGEAVVQQLQQANAYVKLDGKLVCPDATCFSTNEIPTPTQRPSYTPEASTSAGEENTMGSNAPDRESPTAAREMACKLIAEGKAPTYQTRSREDSLDVIKTYFEIRTERLTNPQSCNETCGASNGFLSFLVDKNAASCRRTRNCEASCSTSQIVGNGRSPFAGRGCVDNPRAESSCKSTCGVFTPTTTMRAREIYTYQKFKEAFQDLFARQNGAKKAMGDRSPRNLALRFLCVNVAKENRSLEPLERNNGSCRNTAFGLGQVIAKSFYTNNFGITEHNLRRCGDVKVSELRNCRGINKRYLQESLLAPYANMTPKELFERRSLDVDLQARAMIGTFLTHVRDDGGWTQGWKGYFGMKNSPRSFNSYQAKIESCMERYKWMPN